MQRQARLAEQRKRREASSHARAVAAASRQAEQARRSAERSQQTALRASAADQKRAQAEAKRFHEESMVAEAAQMSAEVAGRVADIDNLLAATLDVDDFVDLESLRVTAEHPPFPRPDLEAAAPPPAPIPPPPEPAFTPPEPPPGMKGKLFGRKKYEEQISNNRAAHERRLHEWREQVAQVPAWNQQQLEQHRTREQQRVSALYAAQALYQRECLEREEQARQANVGLDGLIERLKNDHADAITEYVGIVLSNSVYPESFPVDHDFDFDVAARELILTIGVPAPATMPDVKEYRYVKSKDEIVASASTQKERRERYARAVASVALRSLHEIFEADRDQRIRTIALTVQTESIDVATGRPVVVPLVAVGADRAEFTTYDLAHVEPQATLALMNAAVSKNPYALTPIDRRGVRG